MTTYWDIKSSSSSSSSSTGSYSIGIYCKSLLYPVVLRETSNVFGR
jgi:hypothetical protein